MITATCIKTDRIPDSRAERRLYKLSEYVTSPDGKRTKYVAVSAANVMFSGPETYIFAANKDNQIIDWLEMDGSFKGELSHERAIESAGWQLVKGEMVR